MSNESNGGRYGIVVIFGVVLLFGALIGISKKVRADKSTAATSSAARYAGIAPTDPRCAIARDTMQRAASDLVVFTDPGVAKIHPGLFAQMTKETKDNMITIMGMDKACRSGGDPSLNVVEFRSLLDNRLLGSGNRIRYSDE